MECGSQPDILAGSQESGVLVKEPLISTKVPSLKFTFTPRPFPSMAGQVLLKEAGRGREGGVDEAFLHKFEP